MTPTPKRNRLSRKLIKAFGILAAVLILVTVLLHVYFKTYLDRQLDNRLFGILDFTISEIET